MSAIGLESHAVNSTVRPSLPGWTPKRTIDASETTPLATRPSTNASYSSAEQTPATGAMVGHRDAAVER